MKLYQRHMTWVQRLGTSGALPNRIGKWRVTRDAFPAHVSRGGYCPSRYASLTQISTCHCYVGCFTVASTQVATTRATATTTPTTANANSIRHRLGVWVSWFGGCNAMALIPLSLPKITSLPLPLPLPIPIPIPIFLPLPLSNLSDLPSKRMLPPISLPLPCFSNVPSRRMALPLSIPLPFPSRVPNFPCNRIHARRCAVKRPRLQGSCNSLLGASCLGWAGRDKWATGRVDVVQHLVGLVFGGHSGRGWRR